MKRKEIEGYGTRVWADLKKFLHHNPTQGFFVGLVAGIVIAVLYRILLPLLAIIALVVVVLWLLAEQETLAASEANRFAAGDRFSAVPPEDAEIAQPRSEQTNPEPSGSTDATLSADRNNQV